MKRKLFGSRGGDDYDDLFSGLDESDLIDHGTSSGKFLDRFTEDEVRQLLDESGVFQTIKRKRGHGDLTLTLDLSDAYVHKLYLHSPKTEEPLCELFLRVTKGTDNFKALNDDLQSAVAAGASFVKSWAKTNGPLRMLVIEWMLLQDPFKIPHGIKLLPGQKMIGLGCAQEVVGFIRRLAEELGVDGLMNKPLYFHNAFLYSPFYTFINPEIDAAFQVLVNDLETDIRERGLGTVSHAIIYGALRHRPSGAVVSWTQEEQVRPLGAKLEELLNSPAFNSLVEDRVQQGPKASSTGIGHADLEPECEGFETEANVRTEESGAQGSQGRHSNGSTDRIVDSGAESACEGNALSDTALQKAEAMAYENDGGSAKSDSEEAQQRSASGHAQDAAGSLFRKVLEDFKRQTAAPQNRAKVFEIDWNLAVEDKPAVEERLRRAVPFKEAIHG